MEKYRATKLYTMYGEFSNVVTYEYRGHQYDVEYPNSIFYCCTPAHIQHKDKQDNIDKLIELGANKKPISYEDTVQYALDLFFDSLDGE